VTFTAFYQDIPALSILVAVTFNLPPLTSRRAAGRGFGSHGAVL